MANPAKKYILIAPNGVETTMLLGPEHLKIILNQGFTLKPEPVVRRAVVKAELVEKAVEVTEDPAPEE